MPTRDCLTCQGAGRPWRLADGSTGGLTQCKGCNGTGKVEATTDTDLVHLLPCPFCGSTIVGPLTESTDPRDRLGVIGCGVCGCSGPSLWDTPEELIRHWNERANHADPR
jgi:Lar family restriction alleviation protein